MLPTPPPTGLNQSSLPQPPASLPPAPPHAPGPGPSDFYNYSFSPVGMIPYFPPLSSFYNPYTYYKTSQGLPGGSGPNARSRRAVSYTFGNGTSARGTNTNGGGASSTSGGLVTSPGQHQSSSTDNYSQQQQAASNSSTSNTGSSSSSYTTTSTGNFNQRPYQQNFNNSNRQFGSNGSSFPPVAANNLNSNSPSHVHHINNLTTVTHIKRFWETITPQS
ncbi:unnamed protein product [Ambrosiozyma monospora]|uniref:Unnamed protein product n=1 Tax=Ambrosiozyma monospora TaxID=43982 RepID=A0A9W6WKI7_AMBMO|nr:unnamed protein product [Ambrosiozyma monospora]